jgi:hypothetical protein
METASEEQVQEWTEEAVGLVGRLMDEVGVLHLGIGPECLFYEESTGSLIPWEYWMGVRVSVGDPRWEAKREFVEGLVVEEFMASGTTLDKTEGLLTSSQETRLLEMKRQRLLLLSRLL